MPRPIFITGTGTGIGKTVVAAIVTEALQADYWKPVQAGFSEGTDSALIKDLISNPVSKIYDEIYKLKLAASPHISAREEGIKIDLNKIKENQPVTANRQLIIEGAGGLLVPLNEQEFVIDLIKKLSAGVILVSRNYLGSINHSLLTAAVCRVNNLDIMGWIFNDQYLNYEDEIVCWSGFEKIASIPFCNTISKEFIHHTAAGMQEILLNVIRNNNT